MYRSPSSSGSFPVPGMRPRVSHTSLDRALWSLRSAPASSEGLCWIGSNWLVMSSLAYQKKSLCSLRSAWRQQKAFLSVAWTRLSLLLIGLCSLSLSSAPSWFPLRLCLWLFLPGPAVTSCPASKCLRSVPPSIPLSSSFFLTCLWFPPRSPPCPRNSADSLSLAYLSWSCSHLLSCQRSQQP